MLSGDRAALYSRESKSGIAVSDEALAAWEAAKGKEGSAWVACKYDPAAKDKVAFAASGDGGFTELHAFVAGNEGEVIYGALPFFVDGKRKFSFFTVVGSGVGGMKKARVGMHKNGVYAAFDGVVADVFASGLEEFTEAAVTDKIKKDSAGAAVSLTA